MEHGRRGLVASAKGVESPLVFDHAEQAVMRMLVGIGAAWIYAWTQ